MFLRDAHRRFIASMFRAVEQIYRAKGHTRKADSQAMSRVGEVVLRTWQTADKIKRQRGPLPEKRGDNDNARPPQCRQVHDQSCRGLWHPAFFGVKPEIMLKGGAIAAAQMGDPNTSIPTPQPVHYRPMFGAFGGARPVGSLTFLSQAAMELDLPATLDLQSVPMPVAQTRTIDKHSMVHNDALPRIEVDPETYEVRGR